jgi:hypothetical protein
VRGIAQRATECAVDGIAVTGSVGVLRSSPEAAQRLAGGEGLDGGDPDRSTIDYAVARASDSAERRRPMAASATSQIYTSLTDATEFHLHSSALPQFQMKLQ